MPSKKVATTRGTRRYAKIEGPFHVVIGRAEGQPPRYCIMCNNAPFLGGAAGWEPTDETGVTQPAVPLNRAAAYAIMRLLNGQKEYRRWGSRFGDPYIRARDAEPEATR